MPLQMVNSPWLDWSWCHQNRYILFHMSISIHVREYRMSVEKEDNFCTEATYSQIPYLFQRRVNEHSTEWKYMAFLSQKFKKLKFMICSYTQWKIFSFYRVKVQVRVYNGENWHFFFEFLLPLQSSINSHILPKSSSYFFGRIQRQSEGEKSTKITTLFSSSIS